MQNKLFVAQGVGIMGFGYEISNLFSRLLNQKNEEDSLASMHICMYTVWLGLVRNICILGCASWGPLSSIHGDTFENEKTGFAYTTLSPAMCMHDGLTDQRMRNEMANWDFAFLSQASQKKGGN